MDLPSAAGAHPQRIHVNGTEKQVSLSHRPMGRQAVSRELAYAVREKGKARNIGTWPAWLHDAAYRHLSCPPQRNVRQEPPTGERCHTALGPRGPTPGAT